MKLSKALIWFTAFALSDARRVKTPSKVRAKGSVLNLGFGNGDDIPLQMTAADVIGNITQLKPPPSAVIPLLYNTNLSSKNPDLNPEFITVMRFLKKKNIPFYLSVDYIGDRTGPLNTTQFAETVVEYRKWTDCIQISSASTIWYPNDPQNFVDTMSWLNNTLGFKNIQLNQWPKYGVHGGPVQFPDAPAVNSIWYAVDDETYTVPGATTLFPKYYALVPEMQIMLNYENPSVQVPLAAMKQPKQIEAFQDTIDFIQTLPYAVNNTVLWAVPFTRSYNPQVEGTWNWILKHFVTMIV